MYYPNRFFALLLLLAIALSACSRPPAAPQSTSGGQITRAMTAEPTSIDPQGASNSGSNLLLPYIFDTLVFRERDGTIKPFLAESWDTAPDGKSIVFKLRSGAKFHDGSPLNAEAVAYTFKRFKEVGTKSPIYSGVKDIAAIEPVDELHVRFDFALPSANFFGTLSMPYAGILSPSAMKDAGDQAGRRPVGTGPFKFDDWKAGVSITLVRNPAYAWGPPAVTNKGPAHIEKQIFQLIPDATTQLAALQAGDADVIFINDPAHFAKLEADKNATVFRATLDSLVYLGFNSAKPPFDDPKVRRALAHAVNKTEIVNTALGGVGEVANTPLPPTLLGYNANLKSAGQGYDPAKAKALLAEAGFAAASDGTWQRAGKKLSGSILTSTRAPNDTIATVIQSQLKAIGVPIEIRQLDSAALMKVTNEGNFDLLLWRYDWNDPDALNIYLSSRRIRDTNRVFYNNKDVDALLEKGLRELDPEKRISVYYDAQKIILEEAPWQPLYIPVEGLAISNRVRGVVVGSMGRLLVNDVTIGK